MSPYIRRSRQRVLKTGCPVPHGWLRRDGAMWSCPDCGLVYRLVRKGDFAGNWAEWEPVTEDSLTTRGGAK